MILYIRPKSDFCFLCVFQAGCVKLKSSASSDGENEEDTSCHGNGCEDDLIWMMVMQMA